MVWWSINISLCVLCSSSSSSIVLYFLFAPLPTDSVSCLKRPRFRFIKILLLKALHFGRDWWWPLYHFCWLFLLLWAAQQAQQNLRSRPDDSQSEAVSPAFRFNKLILRFARAWQRRAKTIRVWPILLTKTEPSWGSLKERRIYEKFWSFARIPARFCGSQRVSFM